MAFRLGEHVVCGELNNTRKNSVFGWLGLRGFDRPLTFELTGNCDPDLAGRHIRFEVRNPPKEEDETVYSGESEDAKLERLKLTGLRWQQIGPTGTMTAAHKVRAADCSTEELLFRFKHDEPPPLTWKWCLYLEWFSQNGRVVVELVDPVIEDIAPDGEPQAVPADAPGGDAQVEPPPPSEQGGLGITAVQMNEDGDFETHDMSPQPDEDPDEETDDSYELVPDELQRQLDAAALELDRALNGGSDKDDITRELELMDDLIERGEGEPLGMLFDGPVKLPSPDSLDDAQAEQELKTLLGRLAFHGIAVHMCEHFTPLATYRLIVENLLREQTGYAELRPTQWVQNFMTAEFCEACEAEMDRKFEEEKRRKANDPPEDDAGDAASDDGLPL